MDTNKGNGLSRRSFLKGAALAGIAGIGTGALGGCASASEAPSQADYLPASWDGEADVIAVGYGGAGSAAAITMAMEELGTCIVLEAAPEGEEGGNSRVCGQNMLIPQDVESAIKYQKALNSVYTLSDDPQKEDELYQAWATELCKNKEWLESLGATVTSTNMNSHEFPEIPGNETGATCYLIDNIVGKEALWNVLKEQEEYFDLDIRYGTRAVKLVRNPETNEALGVEADQDGKTVYFKANKGIVLSCGGFENNVEMAKTYAPSGTYWDRIFGTPYNRGDGFKMIAPFGADIWHTNNYTGLGYAYLLDGDDSPFAWMASFGDKDWINVGPNGKRYINEEIKDTSRHGKININGMYQYAPANMPAFTVFGQGSFDTLAITHAGMGWLEIVKGYIADDAQGLLDAGVIKKADTVEELAKIIGYDPATLAETIEEYNGYCADGVDPDFHRGEPIHEELSTGLGLSAEEIAAATDKATEGFELKAIESPYYAMEMRCYMGNTQGGPKRGAGGEVIDVEGNPVPRLYAAGEFGCIYSYQYNGGGNVSEAMSSGRIAARSISALEPWDKGSENA